MVWDVSPEIISFGFVKLRWYSLAFIIGFLLGHRYLSKALQGLGRKKYEDEVSSLFTHVFLGTLVGARLGHCLFYEPAIYLSDPIKILKVWEGGLASHGGYLGLIVTTYLFSRKHKGLPFLWIMDRVAPASLLTGAFIRIGNLFNSEIIGRPSDVPWALVFKSHDTIPRHPSQIYESIGYFAIAFTGFLLLKKFPKKWVGGRNFGLMMVAAFFFRIFVEQFKENQVSFENAMTFNMGQLLSIPYILVGLYLISGKHPVTPPSKTDK